MSKNPMGEKLFHSIVKNLKGRPEYVLATGVLFFNLVITSATVMRNKDLLWLQVLAITMSTVSAIIYLIFIYKIEMGHRSVGQATPKELDAANKVSKDTIPFESEVAAEILQAYLTNHENKRFRDEKFATLKEKASKSILMMGVGMTNLHEDHIEHKYLKKGINVRLLMMNPQILLSHFDFKLHSSNSSDFITPFTSFNALLKETHIDDYFCRKRYFSEVNNSYLRLMGFVLQTQKNQSTKRGLGSIEMRVFNSFIPMSITAVNETVNDSTETDRELIAEFLLPFSAKRIMIPVSRKTNPSYYDEFINSMETVWNKSIDVHALK